MRCNGDAATCADANADAAWRGEMTAEVRHIGATLHELRRDVQELRGFVADEFAAHRAYHMAHESEWGPLRWCEQHPFRLATFVLAAAALLTLHLNHVNWADVIAILARWR